MKVFELFYIFWKVLSFGMIKMQYRAMGSICLVLYLNTAAIIEMLFPGKYTLGSVSFVLGVVLLALYIIGTRMVSNRRGYLKSLDNKVKGRGLVSVVTVVAIKVLSLYFFISVR